MPEENKHEHHGGEEVGRFEELVAYPPVLFSLVSPEHTHTAFTHSTGNMHVDTYIRTEKDPTKQKSTTPAPPTRQSPSSTQRHSSA